MLLFAIPVYTADKLESGKNIVSQGKVRENENFEIMATCTCINLTLFYRIHDILITAFSCQHFQLIIYICIK